MSKFITLDLDYWTMTQKFNSAHTDYLETIIKKSKSTNVVSLHHHVVSKKIIPTDTTEVVNIDFHNDIIDDQPDNTLNEGTWGNFLPKSVQKFTWIYPNHNMCITRSAGICIGSDGWEDPDITHVNYKKIHGCMRYTPECEYNKFAICLSKKWAHYDINPYIEYLRKKKLVK